jgi:hypothetical protein
MEPITLKSQGTFETKSDQSGDPMFLTGFPRAFNFYRTKIPSVIESSAIMTDLTKKM